jgi:nicotinate (nicotinamide) nucleotide adenylyltransferase
VEFVTRSGLEPERVGILAGSFNPPTVAHLELVRAAQAHVDEVVFVLPREFPHKEYFGATLDQRLEMLSQVCQDFPCSIAVSEGGLFIDIAKECRVHYGESSKLYFLCGADAADRIVRWDYGGDETIEGMLDEFELLVAPRGEAYQPPAHLKNRVHPLALQGKHDLVSSTEVRNRVKSAARWEHLVPGEIRETVRAIYS